MESRVIQGVPCHFESILCPKRVIAITLFGHVFFRMSYEEAAARTRFAYDINHERIHTMQMKRDGWLRFYSLYAWEYICNRFRGYDHRSAYVFISYEQEAYANETNLNYEVYGRQD